MTTPSAVDEADIAERALWALFRQSGSATARERLFSIHAAFARAIARRHHTEQSRGDIDLRDMYQLAYAGLLESIDRYDPGRGAAFRPFAAHRISGSIRDGLSHMTEVREQISWRRRLQRERIQSLRESRDGGSDEAQPIENLSDIVIGLALGFMLEDAGFPLDNGTADGAVTRPAAGTAYESTAWREIVQRLQSELIRLPEREREILQKHYLEGVSFDDLSTLFAISKGRISQLHRAGLLQLRKRLKDYGHTQIGNISK
jgi:RNA polymerase sigma factor for flagellar operon FliA